MIGMVNGEHKYTILEAKTDTILWDPRSLKMPAYEKWNDFVDEWDKQAPDSMKNAFQTGELWKMMPTEEAYVTSAV